MDAVLIVVRPFERHSPGDVIADAGQVQAILAGEHRHDVVRVAAQVKPMQPSRGTSV
jgi:hypothetical protein